MRSRTSLATLVLVTAGLGALGPAGPSSAVVDDSTFTERWCSTGAPTPCVEAVTLNGSPVLVDDPVYTVTSTGVQFLDYTDYVMWNVATTSPATGLQPSETWSVRFDMGTMKPRYTEGYSGDLEVVREADGDGTFHVTMTGKPVLMAESCRDDFPPYCQSPTPYEPTVVGSDTWNGVSMRFSGEVWDLDRDDPAGDASWRNGYDRSQNLDGVNDPFFEPTSDGGYRLTVDTYNAARYDHDGDSGTDPILFKGEFKLRLPYALFRQRFEVPDPDTLPVSSLVGATTGDGADGTWTITKDPEAKVFVARVTGITYPDTVSARTSARAVSRTQVRTLRVKRGVITPFAPRDLGARRTTAHRARVTYDPARARGARPTGYTVRCVNLARTHTVFASDTASPTVVTGLRSGKAYDCRVRARSKAGPGAWSVAVRVPARVS
jgi:hypothetical protein